VDGLDSRVRDAPASQTLPPSPPAWRASHRIPAVSLGVVVAVSTGFYLVLARSLWFFSDDWAFLLRRGTVSEDVPGADLGPWAPHNEHWSTGPILLFRALFPLFGLRHFLPYLVPVLAAHASLAILSYLLLVRFGVRRWVAFAAATMLAFNGAGAENILWPFQIGFVGSLALGLLALWCYDHYDAAAWRIWPTWAALSLGLTFSSIGLVTLALVTAYGLCRRGIRGALLVASVPSAVYAVWFAAVGWHGLATTPRMGLADTVLNLPTYIWTVLTHAWEAMSGVPGGGAVLVLVLLAGVLVPSPARARHFAWAGIAAAFLMTTMMGMGRAAFGVEQSKSSRYVYVIVTLMMPMVAVLMNAAADRVAQPRWLATALGVGLLSLVVLNGAHEAYQFGNQRVAAWGSLRDRILGAAALVRQGAPILRGYPEEDENPDVTTDLLGAKEVQEQLPDVTPSAQGLLDAAANLQVLVTSGDLPLPPAPRVVLVDGFAGQADSSPGCHSYAATSARPMIGVESGPAGAKVGITSDSTQLQTRLQRGGLVSDDLVWPTVAGAPQDVGTSAAGVMLLVTLNNSGLITVCT